MPKFLVYEIWTTHRVVEADDEDAALTELPEPRDGLVLSNWHAVPIMDQASGTTRRGWDRSMIGMSSRVKR
jgi:hypothetical protein